MALLNVYKQLTGPRISVEKKKQRVRLKGLFITFSLDACLDQILTDLWSGSSSSLFHVSNRATFFWFTCIINPFGNALKTFQPFESLQNRACKDVWEKFGGFDCGRTARVTCVGPDVRRPISANLGLNFNPSFFSSCSKAFSRTIFSLLFRASNHQIVGKKNKTEFA